MEIERKWLFDIKKVPVELSKTITHYAQGYISIEPEVRIRSKAVQSTVRDECSKTTFKMCIKGNGTISRIEIEKGLTELEFRELMEVGYFTEDELIKKHYYTIPVGDYELTVGVVDGGTDHEFCYGEIEFLNEAEAKRFKAPEWFGRDVTDDPYFKMKNYWKRTRAK